MHFLTKAVIFTTLRNNLPVSHITTGLEGNKRHPTLEVLANVRLLIISFMKFCTFLG